MPWMLAGAAVSAAASVGGGLLSSAGQEKAAAAADEANIENKILRSQLLGLGTVELQRGRDAALASLDQARGDVFGSLESALKRTDPMYAEWDSAYDTGRGDLEKALGEWDSKYSQVRADETPYMDFGKVGLSGYTGLLTDPSSITSNPGYRFRLDQGAQALERSAAAKGRLFSGATGKAMTEYGQEYATSEYDKALARHLAAVNVGADSTARVDSAGMQTASGKSAVYNNLAQLAMQKAAGKSGVAQGQAGLYQNYGSQMAGVQAAKANTNLNASQYMTNFWGKTMLDQTDDNTDSAAQRGSAYANEGNAWSKALGGVGNAISGGIGNYYQMGQQDKLIAALKGV